MNPNLKEHLKIYWLKISLKKQKNTEHEKSIAAQIEIVKHYFRLANAE